MSEVTAYVTEENGEVVLHDPTAEGVIAAIEEHNRKQAYESCAEIFELNSEAIQRFRKRFIEGAYKPSDRCIVILQVDDQWGGAITSVVMPDTDWQPIRDQGLEPIARGIVNRKFMHHALAGFDEKAADDLDIIENQIATVVVAHSVARVFALS